MTQIIAKLFVSVTYDDYKCYWGLEGCARIEGYANYVTFHPDYRVLADK